MAITWTIRTATVTNPVGHSYTPGSPNDSYKNSRFYVSFDITSYADSDLTVTASTADGSITRNETIPSGDPPTSGG